MCLPLPGAYCVSAGSPEGQRVIPLEAVLYNRAQWYGWTQCSCQKVVDVRNYRITHLLASDFLRMICSPRSICVVAECHSTPHRVATRRPGVQLEISKFFSQNIVNLCELTHY
jgi:hypothetical protein